MNILITNDDGFEAKGIKTLAKIMKKFGNVTVVAPKRHQSGMATAVSLGVRKLAYRDLGEIDGCRWAYLDATPASCVKLALNTVFADKFPDLVMSGINHGSNASVAACYSGTLGATEEASLNGIPGIGVSLDTHHPDADFSAIERYLPEILENLLQNLPQKRGVYYNINFPALPAGEIKGVRAGHQGYGRWIREFIEWTPEIIEEMNAKYRMFGKIGDTELEDGEKAYMMTGEFADDPSNDERADHILVKNGYISIVAHNTFTTDRDEVARIKSNGADKDF